MPDSEIVELIDAASRRAKPAWRSGNQGRITPGKITAVLTILGSLALAALMLLAQEIDRSGWFVRAFASVLLIMALFMTPSLTSWHDVVWDDRQVFGASRLFGLTLGWSRTSIAWHEIVRVARTWSGDWYVEAADGRRVHWSYLYPGYWAFVGELTRKRRDLDLSVMNRIP